MKITRDHKNWNKLKEIIDSIDILVPFCERELWQVALGINIGIEMDGKGDDFERPALVIKRVNKDHALIVPITRKLILLPGIHIPLVNSNLDKSSVAVISQLQVVSNKRLMKRVSILSNDQFSAVRKALKDFL